MHSILIVEDEYEIRNNIEKYLSEKFPYYSIMTASNGRVAFDTIINSKVDAMILDICMPVMDGLELLEELSKTQIILPVTVILSGYEEFDYAKKAIDYGVIKYVLKPFTPDQLYSLVLDLTKLIDRITPLKESLSQYRATECLDEENKMLDIPENDSHAKSNNLVKLVKQYVMSHYQTPLNANIIAHALHTNSTYLCRVFKKDQTMSIGEFVHMFRIEKAKQLLTDTNLYAYEISLSVGYENQYYFSTIFKKHTGLSPSEYRNSQI